MHTFVLIVVVLSLLAGLWFLVKLSEGPGERPIVPPRKRTVKPAPMPTPIPDQPAAIVVPTALDEHRRLVSKLQKTAPQMRVAGNTLAGNYKKSQLNPSGQYNLPARWNIDYETKHGDITNRTIRIEHLRLRPLVVEAFCETRNEYRTFYIDGIRKAVDPTTGMRVSIDRYVGHVRDKRAG